MKLNWGTGLTIFIVTFLLVTIGVVLYLMTHDVNLVADNYYEQEIKYQGQIDKIQRSLDLPEQLNIKIVNRNIVIEYPNLFTPEELKGNILCYRPSTNKFDREFAVKSDSLHMQIIKTNIMAQGMWKVKVDWEAKGVTYFNEEIVMLK
jgi:hypothetical protein